MIYRYFCDDCGKTYVGSPLPGKMTRNCQPARQVAGTMITKPLSEALMKVYGISDATALRGQLCANWGIANKSHATHGADFSGNQTLVQLVSNIVGPVSSQDWERVRALVIRDYGYDITTQQMTG